MHHVILGGLLKAGNSLLALNPVQHCANQKILCSGILYIHLCLCCEQFNSPAFISSRIESMSDEDVSQALSLPSAPVARLIDQLLSDNDASIAAAVEAQTAGRLQDMVVYIERLQSNLMRLGKLYDLHALYGGPMPERQPIPTSATGPDFWKLLEHSARQTILAQVREWGRCST